MPDQDFDDFTTGDSSDSGSSVAMNLSDGAKSFIKQNSPGGYNPNEAPRDVDQTRRYDPRDDDPGCIASFDYVDEFKPFKSREATEKKGEPVEIFEKELYIRINIRGSDINEVHRKATQADKARFPYTWQEFNRAEGARARGTPIQMLGLDLPIIRGFAAKNVFTVEDMASVSDNNIGNLGVGAREIRKRAQEFLDARKESPVAEARVNEQQTQIAAQAAQIAAQGDALKQAMALIERLSEQVNKPKRGRPPKTPEGQG